MQRVQVFRCRICGDPYIGFERPSNCPFCGAHEEYLVHSREWRDTNKVDLTKESKKNLEASLKLEISNAEFYLCVSRASRNEEIRAMFKALSKVEAEHASTISKILGIDKPIIEFKRDLCSADDTATIDEADRRENRAVKLYGEYIKVATEPRVKELFTSLVEIECDHIDLLNNDKASPESGGESGEKPPEDNELKKLDRENTGYYESYRLHED